jgi:tRNA(Ile)-lysidine synthase
VSPRDPLSPPLFAPADPGRLPSDIRGYALEEELFPLGGRVLVAVSGGPDSVALLHLLHRLGPEWGLVLGVAHFDHGLRGEASREDARFVAELAQALGLPFHGGAGEVRRAARNHRISLQMAARRLRLEFLHQVRQDHAYHRLALGHTADDQVELFFLRLLRGAGAGGLKGMWPRTPEGLVRPLLAVGKDAVLAWLRHEGLAYREDQSNLSRSYLRNRVRLDLVPGLEQDYNPRLKDAVWRLMALLQEDEAFLNRAAAEAWGKVGRFITPRCAALAIPAWLAQPPALRTRLLRLTLGRFLAHQEITSSQVKSVTDLARGHRSGGVIDFGTCRVARAGAELHFFSPLPPCLGAHPTPLPGIGAVESPEGWRLEAKSFAVPPPAPGLDVPHMVRVDQDKTAFPLMLRGVQPGDRFRSAGGKRGKKMQDFLMDAKIPRWLRPHLPLVADREGVIWVPGLRLADAVTPTPRTARVVQLTLSPAHDDCARVWELVLAFTGQALHPA